MINSNPKSKSCYMAKLKHNRQNGILFIAIDGDDVGVRLREKIVANDIQAMSALSSSIIEYFRIIRTTLEAGNCKIAFCGGDSLLAMNDQMPPLSWFEEMPIGPCTISVGIGETPEFAYLALQLAKARGKNQVVRFEHTIAETVFSWKNDLQPNR